MHIILLMIDLYILIHCWSMYQWYWLLISII